MKMKELRELTTEELQRKHDDLWSDLFTMRVKHSLGQLESPIELRGKRREIARIKTLLTQHGVEERSRRRHKTVAAAAAPVKKASKSAKRGADK